MARADITLTSFAGPEEKLWVGGPNDSASIRYVRPYMAPTSCSGRADIYGKHLLKQRTRNLDRRPAIGGDATITVVIFGTSPTSSFRPLRLVRFRLNPEYL